MVVIQGNGGGLSEAEIDEQIKQRPRSATLLCLKWLAERLRKARSVEQKLKNGTYDVGSEAIAKALLGDEQGK